MGPATGSEENSPLRPAAGVATVVVDERGVVEGWTNAAEDLLGYSAEEMLGRSAATLLVAPTNRIGLLIPSRPDAWDGYARTRHGTGQQIMLRYHVTPLDTSGDTRYLVFITLANQLTDEHRVQQRLALLHAAAAGIGGSLEVTRTAEDLAAVLVPAFGDLATVELTAEVFVGDEPPRDLLGKRIRLRRAAGKRIGGGWQEGLLPPGQPFPPMPVTSSGLSLLRGEGSLLPDREDIAESLRNYPHLVDLILPEGMHSGVTAPLYARGLLLGSVSVWRTKPIAPFDKDDVTLLEEIASRAALSVENARRYTREHRAAVTLQQSLLPHAASTTTAAETTGTYLPTASGIGVGGDWFDVIPLPCLRVAFVVGDVVGHGLHATAAMGRLRTAVATLADLDLEPAELLTRLDDLVTRLAREHPTDEPPVLGATCLYALYDPVSRCLTLASAGHPPPAAVRPDGTAEFLDVPPGPLLGIGGIPFEQVEIGLEEGSVLAFYTDGLIGTSEHDIAHGMERLRCSLRRHLHDEPAHALDTTAARVLTDLARHERTDDVALLLARTRAVRDQDTAYWELPADPSVVAHARTLVLDQLTTWKLDDLAFTTELIVSELVTNAIRYAGGPITLRLIRDEILVCEVSDPSNTQPRLRRAQAHDEGGRGLFLIAQLTQRWGSRYAQTGKTIWTHQPLIEEE